MTLEIPIVLVPLSQSDRSWSLEDKTKPTKIQLVAQIFLIPIWRVIFEGYKFSLWHKLSLRKNSWKYRWKFSKISNFLVYSCSWSELSEQAFSTTQFGGPAMSQIVRWRFIYVNGKLHRETTKPFILTFTGVLYWDFQNLTEQFRLACLTLLSSQLTREFWRK